MDHIKLGTFKTTGQVKVCDPCYFSNSKFAINMSIKPGTWHAYALQTDPEPHWDERIASMVVWHKSLKTMPTTFSHTHPDPICVDAGMVGVFEKHISAGMDDNFTDQCSYKANGIINNAGAITESGYGDGSYTLYYKYRQGPRQPEIIALHIEYIPDIFTITHTPLKKLPLLIGKVHEDAENLLDKRLKGITL